MKNSVTLALIFPFPLGEDSIVGGDAELVVEVECSRDECSRG